MFQLILPFQLDLPFEAGGAAPARGGSAVSLSGRKASGRAKRTRREPARSGSLELPLMSLGSVLACALPLLERDV